MKSKELLAGVMLVSFVAQTLAAETSLPIVPVPVEARRFEGRFAISADTRIVAGGPAAKEAAKLRQALAPAMGFELEIVGGTRLRDNALAMIINKDQKDLGSEGYRLQITPKRVVIRAAGPAGLFYGCQTLRQLLPPAIFRQAKVENVQWSLPCVEITDRPRFQWRGLLVDPARYFIPKSSLLKFIDAMAAHKLNTLQIHLTDDQGWRLEIRKYPKLTAVGAWREFTNELRKDGAAPDGRRHGGFYTQDDIRELVAFAAERHITIVPEIEMPGHSTAAIASYPELGSNPDKPVKVHPGWGYGFDTLNTTDHTVAFMQDVLAEVMMLFPSKFIHIGGDEVNKPQWQSSAIVQGRIKELGLKDEAEMQSWFIKQMDRFLTEHGRRLVGWDEILEGGLAPGATVMSWRGIAGGITAAKAGHDVVMAPTSNTYFDYCQGPPEKEPACPLLLTLSTVYEYDPIPAELGPEQAGRILGLQGQLWGEWIPFPHHLEYMTYPRACALAEVGWSPKERKNYSDFLQRARVHLQRLQALGMNYRPLD